MNYTSNLVVGPVPLPTFTESFLKQEPLPIMVDLLKFDDDFHAAIFEDALRYILLHHDALRMRFAKEGTSWQQFIATPDEAVPFLWMDISHLHESEQKTVIEFIAAETQASLNISSGPLVNTIFFSTEYKKGGWLLMVFSNLVVDMVSLQVIRHDLKEVYLQINQKRTIQLPAKTTSVKEWAERMTAYIQTDVYQEQLRQFELYIRSKSSPRFALPVDYPEKILSYEPNAIIHSSLERCLNRILPLLTRCLKNINIQFIDVLLTALALTFSKWIGIQSLPICLMANGRQTTFNDIDLSRTVGRFASGILEVLDLGTTSQPKEALRVIAEHHHRVTAYSLTTMMEVFSTRQEERWDYFNPQVIFNYLSRQPKPQPPSTQAKYQPAITVTGDCIPRPRLLRCTAMLIEGEPHVNWEYSTHIYRYDTVKKLSEIFIEQLQLLIDSCIAGDWQ